MLDSQLPSPANSSDSALQIQQDLKGERNQVIGQAVSSTIVNVTGGGQVTIYQSQLERFLQAEPRTASAALAPNPYKGLLAFQETDGDRFFGREQQIEQLWQKFCYLHEAASVIRVLPIYGPSGSGKSSLARAGLIPELARRPLPGRSQARVAVLVPGSHPLESLATVLARIATNDPTPVAKTREFAAELAQASRAGEYDGLRRIADVLPDITTSPLIVLVDQFEEVYTLCEDSTERNAFVGNLLYAAADRSKRVSVIITLRSDFLGETQKHPMLNRLFAEQGFLVPAMNEEELRQTIHQPAALAGYTLDEATVSLLIEQTEGREGALPLLQFALTRIWEGLIADVAPVVTLERIGGVGGALAGEAQRVYDSLTPAEQSIARRVFLGLVQLGEGTRDTRRRVAVDSLVSYKDDQSQVKRVIGRFAEPGVRLISCSASNDGIETAEVTHEALFDNWQSLKQWLAQNRDDLRFQRRLEEAAQEWKIKGCTNDYLIRGVKLAEAEVFLKHRDDIVSLSRLAEEFVQRSKKYRQNNQVKLITFVLGLISLLTGLWARAEFQREQSEISELNALTESSKALFVANQNFDALLSALKASLRLKSLAGVSKHSQIAIEVNTALQQAFYAVQERNRLEGHTEPVYSVSFSTDGKTIASASWDRTIKLWTRNGRFLTDLKGHTDDVMSVSFSPDNKLIASASRDKTVKLWSLEGTNLKTFTGHSDGVLGVTFSPDGKTLASASYDKTIKLWSIDGKLLKTITGHTDSVWSVSFSPDGKTLASASRDGSIKLWSIQNGQLLKTLDKHKAHVRSVSFSHDGKVLISSSDDNTVKLWKIDGELLKDIEAHERWVMDARISPDGKTIASASVDGTIKLWKADGSFLKTLTGHNDAVNGLAFSPDGKTIASASADKTIKLWSVDSRFIQSFDSKTNGLFGVNFASDGKTIATSSDDGKVQLWNIDNGLIKTISAHEGRIPSVSFSPKGEIIASGSWDGTIKLWNRDGKLLNTLTTADKWLAVRGSVSAGINSVVFSPDGQMLASVGYDKKIRLWHRDGTPLKVIENVISGRPETDIIYSVRFSPDGRMVATAGWDRAVKLWNIDGKLLQTLVGHSNRLFGLSFSPDGKVIASSSLDRTIKLWSIDGKLIKTLAGHQAVILAVSFSPDGKLVASASDDNTARLWSIDGILLKTLSGHTNGVYGLSFSPDGKILATASGDGSLKLWSTETLDTAHLIERSCNWLHDYLQNNASVSNKDRNLCRGFSIKK